MFGLGDLKDIIELFSNARHDKKHIFVIAIGLTTALTMSIFLIGQDNISAFFKQFNTDIGTSGALQIGLFLSNGLLASVFIIAGLLELSISKEFYPDHVPPPPHGAWLLNIFVSALITLQLYTSITNILQYCLLYTVFIFIDFYFRYSIACTAHTEIENILHEMSESQDSDGRDIVGRRLKYLMLTEVYVYYKRYPVIAISTVRLLLSFLSIVLIITERFIVKPKLLDLAYINMIYCIIFNEIFSWGYRVKLVSTLRHLKNTLPLR